MVDTVDVSSRSILKSCYKVKTPSFHPYNFTTTTFDNLELSMVQNSIHQNTVFNSVKIASIIDLPPFPRN